MTAWRPEFDRVGMALSVAALLVLLFFGLTVQGFAVNLWVAFAFWFVGFGGTLALGLAYRTSVFSLKLLLETSMFTGVVMFAFLIVNWGASGLAGDLWLASKLVSFGIGVSEELFFGVFLLVIMIAWIGLPKPLAIAISAGVHAWYHTPNWGVEPVTISIFFVSFLIARTIFVFVYPKVGMLLAAHGFWNLAVS